MKKPCNTLIACILLSLLITSTTILFAQPPPPPPSEGHGLENDGPPGAGAPIGEGLFLLIGIAGLYAGKKLFDQRKKSEIE